MRQPPRSARRGTSVLASGPQIEDEEWAAYFRNNLLKSCWKPGLRNEEVQAILTLAERKLVEVIHRWTHPGIWIAYKLWKRRTWKLDRLQFIIMRARHYKERKAWDHWRKLAKLRTIHPFVDQQRMLRKLRLWHRKALKLKALHCSKKAAPFKQLKERTLHMANRKRLLRKAAAGFKARDDVRAYNKWCEASRRQHAAAARTAVSLSSWARGSEKRAVNQWRAMHAALEPVRLVYSRWMSATMYACCRRWALEYVGRVTRLEADARRKEPGLRSRPQARGSRSNAPPGSAESIDGADAPTAIHV